MDFEVRQCFWKTRPKFHWLTPSLSCIISWHIPAFLWRANSLWPSDAIWRQGLDLGSGVFRSLDTKVIILRATLISPSGYQVKHIIFIEPHTFQSHHQGNMVYRSRFDATLPIFKKKCFPLCQTYKPTIIQVRFPKSGPTYRGQVINPRHQTPQGQSVAKPGTPL